MYAYLKYSFSSEPVLRLRASTRRLKVRVRLKPRPGKGPYDISGSYQVFVHEGRQSQISFPFSRTSSTAIV